MTWIIVNPELHHETTNLNISFPRVLLWFLIKKNLFNIIFITRELYRMIHKSSNKFNKLIQNYTIIYG